MTNPPLDAIREELVTSTEVMMGTELNLLETIPASCHQIKLKTPILTNAELAKIRHIQAPGFQSKTLPMLFNVADGVAGLERALEEMYATADAAIEAGVNVFILSDRSISAEQAPIPAALAVSGLHHHLIRAETRTQMAMIVETAEAREIHHFSVLIGYGATAINPYLAYDSLRTMIEDGSLVDIDYPTAEHNYVKAANKGIVKVLSKMGISTVQSYCGAQIFEALA